MTKSKIKAPPLVAVILGSTSDWETMKNAGKKGRKLEKREQYKVEKKEKAENTKKRRKEGKLE